MERCVEDKEEGLNLEVLATLCHCQVHGRMHLALDLSSMSVAAAAEQHLPYSTEILKIPATMAVGHNVEGDLSNTEVAAV